MSILIANAFIGDGPFDGRTDGRTRTFNNHNFCANKRWVMVIRGSKWLCTIIEFLASLLTSPMEKLFNHSVSYFSHSYSFFPLFSLMIFFFFCVDKERRLTSSLNYLDFKWKYTNSSEEHEVVFFSNRST